MAELSISQVAQLTGVRPSTMRYYEEIGLLSPTRRIGNRRQYDDSILQRLALIQTGQQAGFKLAELKTLLDNIRDAESGNVEWHELISRKLREMDMMQKQIERMKGLLADIMDCEDDTLAECIVLTGQKHYAVTPIDETMDVI